MRPHFSSSQLSTSRGAYASTARSWNFRLCGRNPEVSNQSRPRTCRHCVAISACICLPASARRPIYFCNKPWLKSTKLLGSTLAHVSNYLIGEGMRISNSRPGQNRQNNAYELINLLKQATKKPETFCVLRSLAYISTNNQRSPIYARAHENLQTLASQEGGWEYIRACAKEFSEIVEHSDKAHALVKALINGLLKLRRDSYSSECPLNDEFDHLLYAGDPHALNIDAKRPRFKEIVEVRIFDTKSIQITEDPNDLMPGRKRQNNSENKAINSSKELAGQKDKITALPPPNVAQSGVNKKPYFLSRILGRCFGHQAKRAKSTPIR